MSNAGILGGPLAFGVDLDHATEIVFAQDADAASRVAADHWGGDPKSLRPRRLPDFDRYASTGVPDVALYNAQWWQSDETLCVGCYRYQYPSIPQSTVCPYCENCTDCGCNEASCSQGEVA